MQKDTSICDILSALLEEDAVDSATETLTEDPNFKPMTRPSELGEEPRDLQAAADKLGGIQQTVLFHGFDGKQVVGKVSVEASRTALPELAKIVAKRNPGYKAVIFTVRGKSFLIWVSSIGIVQPTELKYQSSNPNGDWGFIHELTREISNLASERNREHSTAAEPDGAVAKNLKCWLNIKDGKTVNLPLKTRFSDMLAQRPELFGVPTKENMTPLKARIYAERNGWVQCGVNAMDQNNVFVVVSAMIWQQAVRAAQIMAHKSPMSTWKSLKLVTNDKTQAFSPDEIRKLIKPGSDDNTVYL